MMKTLRSNIPELETAAHATILHPANCSEWEQRIVVMDKQECIFLKVNTICYIEGDGAYTILVLQNGKRLIVSKNMKMFPRSLQGKVSN